MIKPLFLIFINIHNALMFKYQKPIAEKVWSEHCVKNSHVLNDCNWCWCDTKNRYACQARHCSEVDMFGHFNDAIQAMDVGMEGHGVWRSSETACEPGVHYTKDELLCVCSEDGTWPNPVCRDIFRVLHMVEVTNYTRPERAQSCSPSKLHLLGCNVCFCPSSGYVDPKLCTHRQCHEEIPDTHPEVPNHEIDEIYANCRPDKTYKLGCKTCICLRNNRLLCDNCTSEDSDLRERATDCSGRSPWVQFQRDCNTCMCDDEQTIYCTTEGCSKKHESVRQRHNLNAKNKKPKSCTPGAKWKKDCNRCKCLKDRSVRCSKKHCIENPPGVKDESSDENDCVANTSWKDGCNTCRCTSNKAVYCTMKNCYTDYDFDELRDKNQKSHCVPKTSWRVDCNRCTCRADGKTAICTVIQCLPNQSFRTQLQNSTTSCNPGATWKKECNTCTCMADGKTAVCTSKQCLKKDTLVKLLNAQNALRESNPNCPKGKLFKVDCNYCICIENGDLICTTRNCEINEQLGEIESMGLV